MHLSECGDRRPGMHMIHMIEHAACSSFQHPFGVHSSWGGARERLSAGIHGALREGKVRGGVSWVTWSHGHMVPRALLPAKGHGAARPRRNKLAVRTTQTSAVVRTLLVVRTLQTVRHSIRAGARHGWGAGGGGGHKARPHEITPLRQLAQVHARARIRAPSGRPSCAAWSSGSIWLLPGRRPWLW